VHGTSHPIYLLLYWLSLVSINAYAELANGFRTTTLQAEPLQVTIQRMGQADYRHLTTLSFQSAGYIEQLSLDEGDLIQQGEIVATLDTSVLKANLASARADHANAVSDLARAEKLFAEKTVSADYLENAQTILKTSRAQLEVARFNLRKAQIRAPFDGLVIARLAQSGELVSAGTPVYQVARQSGDYIVRLALTQEEIGLVTRDHPVQVHLGGNQHITAVIDKIATRADPASGMYQIEIALPNSQSAVRAGQWLNLALQVSQQQLVFRIPLKALNKIEKDHAFFLIEQQGEIRSFSAPILHFDQHAVYLPAQQPQLKLVLDGWSTQLLETKIKAR